MKAQDLSGKVVMMAFGCPWLKYEKKSWINSPEMEVTHCFLLTKVTRTKLPGNIFDTFFFVLKYGTHVLEDSLMGLALFKHEQNSRRRRYHIIYL